MNLEGMQMDRWLLRRYLGSGTMGEVYLAEDRHSTLQVAVKVWKNGENLSRGAQTADSALRLFWCEMRAVGSLAHPHILPLHDFGEQTINNSSYTYIVMLFCPEGSLLHWLEQRNSPALLSSQRVIQIVNQVADALQQAHNCNMKHLNIKPSNFLMHHHEDSSRYTDILLADLGIAKFPIATSAADLTMRGTPPYMAPEQWTGTPVAATDQYALAITAYQLLTGRLPFEGNMQQVKHKHLQEPPQPPSVFTPRIPPDVDSVILKALRKKPEDRFPSVQAFATAFAQA